MDNMDKMVNEEGLILPKKLINPCLESKDRQNLHRELMFNQKIGKNVLNQKTELQKALQRQKERQFIAAHQYETESTQQPCNNLHQELGRVITERAQKIESSSKDDKNSQNNSEFLNEEYLKARAKLRGSNKLQA